MANQLALSFYEITEVEKERIRRTGSPVENLIASLSDDLNFQDKVNDAHLSHKAHSFPAKFPPQLPSKFILELTGTGDVVLDPMMGSGTTVLEAFVHGRKAIGFDIDPLAILIAQVKIGTYDVAELHTIGHQILQEAEKTLRLASQVLVEEKKKRFTGKTLEFIDYWFVEDVQMELLALLIQIEKIENEKVKNFFNLIFSSIIITKTGGVSLALDLAHTRPHKAKTVLSKTGDVLIGDKNEAKRHLVKKLRSPLAEFRKKLTQNLRGVIRSAPSDLAPIINFGNAQFLALPSDSVDLIVTSPPYVANAIDYMRAHKFSLIWFGYPIEELSEKRRTYIGGEGLIDLPDVELPESIETLVTEIGQKSKAKSVSVRRYYVEMTHVLQEMFRVLESEKPAIVVVGNSILAGFDVQIEKSLVEIGRKIGFEIPRVGIRLLDRNRRMLPAGLTPDMGSQIQQRMHKEYVIGFYKP